MFSSIFQKFKPISISLSPNTEKDDVWLALKLIFQPWQWKKGKKSKILEKEFKRYLGIDYAFSFNSGRSCLMATLEAINIKQGDEVLIQAFTCNAVVNPILEKKAKPVFIDIDKTLNIDPEDFRKKITSRSKAVIIQHTFGCPAQIEAISNIAKENNLLLIEDCAHALGVKHNGIFCGTFGDVSFFSFGRDKMISSVYGGMAASNNKEIASRLEHYQQSCSDLSSFWILQQLLHPVLMNCLILPTYNLFKIGRAFLALAINLRLLSKAVVKKEGQGKLPDYFPAQMPNALAILALNQLKKIERFNQHRCAIAQFYMKELEKTGFILPITEQAVFMKFPILCSNPEEILLQAKKRGIILYDGWRSTVVVPMATNLEKMGYEKGLCPRAEDFTEKIINLPTHINIKEKQARVITDFLKKYDADQRNR